MKLKASLHLHSEEDIEDYPIIKYSLYELIDRAAELDFKVLASTGHFKGVCGLEQIEYAKQKGILLIPGVEAEIDGHRHVLILNGGKDAEAVKTFEDLRSFKSSHLQAFIIAPHPNHRKHSLTLDKLRQHKDIFDAVEHSWFYSSLVNPNFKTGLVSDELALPFIATADAHVLDYLNTDYAIIDAEQMTSDAVFSAIRSGNFINFTKEKGTWELISFVIKIFFRMVSSISTGKSK